MTDWTGIAAVIAPVTTLLGGIGGYLLAGRNDESRDRRAFEREEQARRDAFAERLEEDRHTFQRDTLLELQDQLQRLVRNTAQVMHQDQATIRAQGQMYLLGGDLSEQAMAINVSVSRLKSRVLDDGLRAAVGEFASLCSGLDLGLMQEFPGGRVPDEQRDYAIDQLQRRTVRMASAYSDLAELLGVHLRRELDRRYLVAAPDPGETGG